MNQLRGLDPFIPGSGLLHRVDPRLKLVGTVAYVLLVSTTPWNSPSAHMALAVLAGLVWWLSGIAPKRIAARMLPLAAFGALAAVGALLQPGSRSYWSGHVLWLDLQISNIGVQRFVLLTLHAALSAMMVGTYIAVTPFNDSIQVLRRFGVPVALTATLGFVYRYLFLLADEARRLELAREARTLRRPSLLRLGVQMHYSAGLMGSLLVRSYGRGERVYWAMTARGYTGEMRTLKPPHWTSMDTRAGAFWGAALGLVALMTWL